MYLYRIIEIRGPFPKTSPCFMRTGHRSSSLTPVSEHKTQLVFQKPN